MKLSRWYVILVAVLFAGCGDRNVILKVDLASHLKPSERQVSIPSVPVVSGGFASGVQALVGDQNVNMLGGLGDAIIVHDVQLTMTSIASATSGVGTDTLRVYVSDEATDPGTTAPVITQILHFTVVRPDTVISPMVTSGAEHDRIVSLFAQKALRMKITTSLRGPASGLPLNGASVEISGLAAEVTAGRKRI